MQKDANHLNANMNAGPPTIYYYTIFQRLFKFRSPITF